MCEHTSNTGVCFSEWQSGVHRAPNHPWSRPLQVRLIIMFFLDTEHVLCPHLLFSGGTAAVFLWRHSFYLLTPESLQFVFLKLKLKLLTCAVGTLIQPLTHRVSVTNMNSHGHYLKVSFTVAAPSPCCINLHILYSGQKKDNNHLLLTVELICLIWSSSHDSYEKNCNR